MIEIQRAVAAGETTDGGRAFEAEVEGLAAAP